MGQRFCFAIFVAGVMATGGAFSAVAAEKDPTQEIVARCQEQMGQYGAAMVKACADQDIEAVNALSKYPDQDREMIARCFRTMKQYGWAMVKACAD